MKFPFLVIGFVLLAPLPAVAAEHAHAAHKPAGADVSWAEGTVKKLDRAAGKATIAHGPIESIGMAPMTMVFAVRDAAGLGKLKEGDKVRFQATMAGGEIVVTRIETR
jgi:Cu/Ag efflux protein CusF